MNTIGMLPRKVLVSLYQHRQLKDGMQKCTTARGIDLRACARMQARRAKGEGVYWKQLPVLQVCASLLPVLKSKAGFEGMWTGAKSALYFWHIAGAC
eukprot:350005-Chlamydomonas_euryale.AAC.4